MGKYYCVVFFLLFVVTIHASAGVLNVPGTYASIQTAINASAQGDTVLVQPGTYFENINFRGKNIVVTSTFYLANDLNRIDSTIINGSTPLFPDTGSCVLIISGEDTTAVLQGFTLTGGTGTLWPDEHSAGSYVEGGGILIALSSPTIRHNIIKNNNVNRAGGTSTGGGGIRLGDASPRILNNIIMFNAGQYGGGIVSNYATPIIRNNIIGKNRVLDAVGGPTFGGGGVWINHDPATIENNTIVENSSSGTGSGVAGLGGGVNAVFGGQIVGRNNIIWGNTQVSGGQVSGTASLTYSDVEGGFSGTGNINIQPLFADSSYYLRNSSPCIDGGDPSQQYNDPEDLSSVGHAKRPAKGMLRNDMGGYGGPNSEQLFVSLESPVFSKILSGQIVSNGGASRSVNWVDYDNDGILDLFVSNGLSIGQNNFLYHGDGPPNYTFTKITGSPIVNDNEKSDGSTWADFDNDGDLDAFVVNWYGDNNMFYWNNGNGTFTQSFAGPLVNDGGFSETAGWGDYDNDGFVDLYVSNSGGDLKNFLYHNNGDSTFTKITTGDMVNDTYHSRGNTWVDYDNDGDEDMFVVNENGENNSLYKNMLKETASPDFMKITSGAIVNDGGDSWSASWGDYDNDGDQDVFVANQADQNNFLYRNNGDGTFTKITSGILVNDGGRSASSAWGDVDNDGDLDLFVTNAYGPTSHKNFLYRNLLVETRFPTFEKIISGTLANDLGWSYGASFGDYDNDGDLDVFVAKTFNENENNALYKNENDNGNHWLEVKCIGTSSNRSAIGAKIRIEATLNGHSVRQVREISGQSGYCGQNLIAHIGLGDAAVIDSLIFEWPSGATEIFNDIIPNQILSVTEQDTNPPTLCYPSNGSLNENTAVLFRWNTIPNNPLYHLEVGTDSLCTSLVFDDSTLTDTSKLLAPLIYGTTYYWRVAMKKLNRASSWSEVRNFYVGPDSFTYTVDARWNIVSIPAIPVDARKDSLFPDAASPAYECENGISYQTRDTLDNGIGYWIKFPSTQNINLTGFPRLIDTIDVNTGWNLIGTLSQPMPSSSVTSIPDNIINSNFFGYKGGYKVADSLEPLRGYWVKVNQGGEIILSSSASSFPKATHIALQQNINTLQFEDSNGDVQLLSFAAMNNEVLGKSNYELPPRPPLGMFDVRFQSGRFIEFVDVSASQEFPISVSGSSGPISISWKVADSTFFATLLIDGKELSLRGNGRSTVPIKNTQITLLVKQTEIPSHFSIHQNYPNPFNPTTMIEYSLPFESFVRLSVFNVLGEQIAQLVGQIQEAKRHQIRWDAQKYPSGMYIYRITAVSTQDPKSFFSDQKKMVLLK